MRKPRPFAAMCPRCPWGGRRQTLAGPCPGCGHRPLLPRQSEREFQGQVTGLATLCGWVWDHDHDPRRKKAGWPDLSMIHERRGLMIWAELKVPPYGCTPAQLAMHARLRAAGQVVYVWRPHQWGEVQRVLKGG